jgi:hypothetical protein
MQRLTARLLLLFALLGTFLPIALEATSAPAHACCRRTSAHHCNDTAGTRDETAIHSNAECCNPNAHRAVTTSLWADPEPLQAGVFAPRTSVPNTELRWAAPLTRPFSSQSTRAPPAC